MIIELMDKYRRIPMVELLSEIEANVVQLNDKEWKELLELYLWGKDMADPELRAMIINLKAARGEEIITPTTIQGYLTTIKCAAMVEDDEAAAGLERKLYLKVISAIAEDRCFEPKSICQAALETQTIEFRRS